MSSPSQAISVELAEYARDIAGALEADWDWQMAKGIASNYLYHYGYIAKRRSNEYAGLHSLWGNAMSREWDARSRRLNLMARTKEVNELRGVILET